jgi:phage baseplate assembly protein V
MMHTVEPGVIAEVKGNKARVQIGIGVTTDFIHCPQVSNSFKRFWSPLRVGEQCYVVAVRGSINEGFIVRGIYYNKDGYKASDGANENTEITEYEDGTKISYNIESKQLNVSLAGGAVINIVGSANIMVGGNLNVKASKADITANTANIKAETTHTGNIIVEGSITATKTVTALSVIGTTVTVGGAGGSELKSESGKFSIDRPLDVKGDVKSSGLVYDKWGAIRTQNNNGGGN